MSGGLAERETTEPRLRVLAGWLVAAGAVFGAGYTVMFIEGLDLLARTMPPRDLFIPLHTGVWFAITAGTITALMVGAHLRRRQAGARVGAGRRVVAGLVDAFVWWWSTWLLSLVPMLLIGILLRENVTQAALAMLLVVGPLVALCLWPFLAELLWPATSRGDDPRTNRAVWLWRYLAFRTGKSPVAGDVWFADVKFAEGRGSKDRPVLILGPSDHFTWEALMFTSADKRGRPGYFRSDTLIRGQRKSWLKINRLVDLKPGDLRVRAGAADLETLKVAHSARQTL